MVTNRQYKRTFSTLGRSLQLLNRFFTGLVEFTFAQAYQRRSRRERQARHTG
jgi:hypothetical protein